MKAELRCGPNHYFLFVLQAGAFQEVRGMDAGEVLAFFETSRFFTDILDFVENAGCGDVLQLTKDSAISKPLKAPRRTRAYLSPVFTPAQPPTYVN